MFGDYVSKKDEGYYNDAQKMKEAPHLATWKNGDKRVAAIVAPQWTLDFLQYQHAQNFKSTFFIIHVAIKGN